MDKKEVELVALALKEAEIEAVALPVTKEEEKIKVGEEIEKIEIKAARSIALKDIQAALGRYGLLTTIANGDVSESTVPQLFLWGGTKIGDTQTLMYRDTKVVKEKI